MKSPASSGGALSGQFRAFHAELVAFTRALTPESEPEQVRTQLCALIQGLAQDLDGRRAQDNGYEARYLMAAFADEVLIATPWAHRERWIDFLLEERLFGTRDAGDTVVARIDELLLARDPDRIPLARPYLYALALGFRGRFGGSEEDLRELGRRRTALFKLANSRDPDPAFGSQADPLEHGLGARLMSSPYEHTIASAAPVMLPNPSRWRIIFCCAVGALLLTALAIWMVQTRELRAHFKQTGKSAFATPFVQAPAPASATTGGAP